MEALPVRCCVAIPQPDGTLIACKDSVTYLDDSVDHASSNNPPAHEQDDLQVLFWCLTAGAERARGLAHSLAHPLTHSLTHSPHDVAHCDVFLVGREYGCLDGAYAL